MIKYYKYNQGHYIRFMCVVFDKGLNDLGYSYSIFKNNCLGDSYTMDLCNLFHNNLKEFNNQFTEKKIRNL